MLVRVNNGCRPDIFHSCTSAFLPVDSWLGKSFPRRRVASALVLGRLVCLEALEEDPGWFLCGHILGNLRQTVTQP